MSSVCTIRTADQPLNYITKTMTSPNDAMIAQLKKGLALSGEASKSSHTAAVTVFASAAATGDKHAKYQLAAAILRGHGCARNESRAEELLREAAKEGDLSALVTLAARQSDTIFASKVYKFAADKGHPVGMFNLGLCHFEGIGVERDYNKGLQLCARAAHWGDNNARYQLARWLLIGDFVVLDEARGMELLNLAADEGHLESIALLARCLIMGYGGNRDNVACQRQLRAGAARDDAKCAFLLGLYFANGLLDCVTDGGAIEWLEKASSLGCGDADFHLGLLYLRGTGVLKNKKKATDCFHQALNRGCVRAAGHLKSIYALGIGVEKNAEYVAKLTELGRSEAEKLSRQVVQLKDGNPARMNEAWNKLKNKARKGDSDAKHHLALLYVQGRAVKKDHRQAMSLWKQAALDGHPESLWQLGRRYIKGDENVKKDERRGQELLREAVGLEHTEALCMMAYEYAKVGRKNRAIPLYTRAGDAFSAKALFNRGLLLSDNDDEKWDSWREAAIAGSTEAYVNLGVAYEMGTSRLERNLEQAYHYYEKAAKNGSIRGALNAGALMEKQSSSRSYTDARNWYRQAAESGNAEGMRRLGNLMSHCNEASSRDKLEGPSWTRKAQQLFLKQ